MIDIRKLQITTPTHTLVDISLKIKSSLALVGESGSGKSLTLKAILNLLPQNLKLSSDIRSEFDLVRGKSIAYVPQNPFTALSALTKIKKHFSDNYDPQKLFNRVGLDRSLLDRFSIELSGGQLQRVVLAIALSHSPKLLLLDEPTTALDSKTAQVIITLLKQLQQEMGFKMLFVTHNISQAKELCDEISVIKKGQIIESGSAAFIIDSAQHRYTIDLIEANFKYRGFRE